MEKLKRREVVGITFPMQKKNIFFKNRNIHSFVDGGSKCHRKLSKKL
jgi:hypothetical protein